MATNTSAHGGKRAGSGRPPGVPNKIPARAKIVQEKLLERLEPHLDLMIETAVALLSNPNTKPQDKNATLKLLFDLVSRSAAQDVVDGVVEAAGSLSVSDLLRARSSSTRPATDGGETANG